MTLKQAADYVKLDEKIVGRMAQRGDIPAQRVARQWQFDRVALVRDAEQTFGVG